MTCGLAIFLLIAGGVLASAPAASTAAPPAKLIWLNGEQLPGEIAEASATEVTWKSPLFEEPLVLRWNVLRRIDQALETAATPDAFGISLRDGSYMFGEVVSVDEKSVGIRSSRHGEAVLNRAQVLKIQRLRGGRIVAAGPAGDVGWELVTNPSGSGRQRGASAQILGSRPEPIRLTEGPGGVLALPFWNTGAAMKVALPEMVEVDFSVRSSQRPEFQIVLEGDQKQRLRIETWNDELVLVAGLNFKSLRKIPNDAREVALRILWDRKANKCSVFEPNGSPENAVVNWDVPEDADNVGKEIVLHNRGRDLTLEMLRVRTWDG